MRNLKLLFLCWVSLMITSCTREFVPEFSQVKKKIVVNSLINNLNEISISVTESLSPGESFDLTELVDASVVLYEDDLFLSDLDYEKTMNDTIGYFVTENITVIPNKEYRVDVESIGYEDVSAVARVPDGADIDNASVTYVGGNSYNYYFTINNTPESNFYYFKLYFRAFIVDELTGERIYLENEIVEIPEGAIPSGQKYLDNGYIFTDESLKAGENIFTGIAKSGIAPSVFDDKPEDIQLDTSQLFIYLETLSEDAYKFYYSHSISLFSDTDFFSESAPIFTNIDGGLGIFAGIYKSEVGVEVE